MDLDPKELTKGGSFPWVAAIIAAAVTAIGALFQWHAQTDLAARDFQSKLILRAVEQPDTKSRKASLQFLLDAGLISDALMASSLKNILANERSSVPVFLKGTAVPMPGTRSKSGTEMCVTLGDDSAAALIGFVVREGWVIDAIRPIFIEYGPDPERLKPMFEVREIICENQAGGTGGKMALVHPKALEGLVDGRDNTGVIVTGLQVQYAGWYGARQMVRMRVIWQRWDGKSLGETIESRWYGNRQPVEGDKGITKGTLEKIETLRTPAGSYIVGFDVDETTHTGVSKPSYIGKIRLKSRKLEDLARSVRG